MANTSLKTRIKNRIDTTANWDSNNNQILANGEIGIERTTSGEAKIKIGDGVKTWAQLDYINTNAGSSQETSITEMLLVPITVDDTNDELEFSSTTSFTEIKAAYQAGKYVYASAILGDVMARADLISYVFGDAHEILMFCFQGLSSTVFISVDDTDTWNYTEIPNTVTYPTSSIEANAENPPRAGDVYNALQAIDTNPHLIGGKYTKVTEDTVPSNVTYRTISSTIGDETYTETTICDTPIISVTEDDNTFIHIIPTSEMITNYTDEKVKITIPNGEVETGFVNWEYDEDITPITNITFTDNTGNLPTGIYGVKSAALGNPLGNYAPETVTFDIDNNELTFSRINFKDINFSSESSVKSIKDYYVNGERFETYLYYYNIANLQEVAELAFIYSQSNLANFPSYTINKIENSQEAYCFILSSNNNFIKQYQFLAPSIITTNTNLVNLTISIPNLYRDREYYLRYNTNTSYAAATTTTETISTISLTHPAFVASFIDPYELQIISCNNLSNKNIKVEILMQDTIKWGGEQVKVGPGLTVVNNKIDLPYGPDHVYKTNQFTIEAQIGNSPSTAYAGGKKFLEISENFTITQSTLLESFGHLKSIPATIVINGDKKYSGTITWYQDNSELWGTLNYSKETVNIFLEHGFTTMPSPGLESLKPQALLKFSPDNSSNNLRITFYCEKIDSFTSAKIIFQQYNYGTKKIPKELVESDAATITTTDLITENSDDVLTSGGAYTAFNNLATIATSGDYDDLSNKPALFSGSYTDLTDQPSLFSGAYNDLSGKPTLGTAAAGTINTNAIADSDDTSGSEDTSLVTAAQTATYVKAKLANLSGALRLRGASTTSISNGGTETATISGSTLTATAGDVVLYNGKEFVWNGSAWIQLGDESSWVPNTRTVNGYALSSNVTLTASDISGALTSSDIANCVFAPANTTPVSGNLAAWNSNGEIIDSGYQIVVSPSAPTSGTSNRIITIVTSS